MQRKNINFKQLIFGVLLLVAFVGIVRSLIRVYSVNKQVAELKSQVAGLMEEKSGLETDMGVAQSPDFVEQEARDKLSLIKPGDTVVVIDEKVLNNKGQVGQNNVAEENDGIIETRLLWQELLWRGLN
ncbi:septum formation initiator family protein [candidate division WWE3 bacterium]|uniref:Septum formation initiator family protein n=1 Tax=candidate division WWE3 bacterium TaxID=2053526 RepID=A0A955LJJ5_UNCKA|nr:septum formation initiator family protein [candidate division WWE3 bacterium]